MTKQPKKESSAFTFLKYMNATGGLPHHIYHFSPPSEVIYVASKRMKKGNHPSEKSDKHAHDPEKDQKKRLLY